MEFSFWNVLFLLAALACPVIMWLMMRFGMKTMAKQSEEKNESMITPQEHASDPQDH